MKKFLFPPILLINSLLAQETTKIKEQAKVSLEESTRHSSLSLGYQEGIRTARQQLQSEDLNKDAYLEGFLRGLAGEKLDLTAEEVKQSMIRLQEKLSERDLQTAQKNLAASNKFLAANKSQKGVNTAEAGFQYRVVNEGEGEPYGKSGLAGKDIFLNFRGTLPDGTEFAKSNPSAPAKINLDEVVAGFRSALTLMRKGDKWVTFIPANLAYGDQRRSSHIGPNQLLIFEIELVDVRDKNPPSK